VDAAEMRKAWLVCALRVRQNAILTGVTAQMQPFRRVAGSDTPLVRLWTVPTCCKCEQRPTELVIWPAWGALSILWRPS
jgi:hypothetical protein